MYWGGPTFGLTNATGVRLPPGATVLVQYNDPRLGVMYPASVRYRGAGVNALFNSPHPEAVAGSGMECVAPYPPGCLTEDQQLENWTWLGNAVNELTGSSWVVPGALPPRGVGVVAAK